MSTHHCQTHDELYPIGMQCKYCMSGATPLSTKDFMVPPPMVPQAADVTEDDWDKLLTERDDLRAQVDGLSRRIADMETRWTAVDKEYHAKCDRVEELKKEKEELETRWASWQAVFQEKCEELNTLRQREADLGKRKIDLSHMGSPRPIILPLDQAIAIQKLDDPITGADYYGEGDDPPVSTDDDEWPDDDPEVTITLPPINADEASAPADDDKPIIERHPRCDTHPEELATGHVTIHHTELRRICGKCVQPNRPTQNDIKP